MTEEPKKPDAITELENDVEGLEPSAGVLAPSDELEAALREATESMAARAKDEAGDFPAGSPDKVMLELLSDELRALTETHTEKLSEFEELSERHTRLQAEFENFRRRGLKERQETLQFGHQNVVKDLLPVVDNLERAVAHSEESDGADLQSLLQGVDLVLKELLGVLAKHGVLVIETESQVFDPEVHEAMAQVADDSMAPNMVAQVLQRGYMLRNRMLRPARVIVSKAVDVEENESEKDD
jgi:molecular chaperone GrpE